VNANLRHRQPLHPEWWIVPTPEGLRVVAYRPRTMTGTVGPFATELTAQGKLAELRLEERRLRILIRTMVAAVGIIALTLMALLFVTIG
jgi:hypothetical protein